MLHMKKSHVPLIIESHPSNYIGFPFITLIQYHKSPMVCVVDNIGDSSIRAFVLDMCGPAGVDEEIIVNATQVWYDQYRAQYPVSVYFSREGLSSVTTKIFRTLNVEFVSRVIGPVPNYPMTGHSSLRRRKRKVIPSALVNR